MSPLRHSISLILAAGSLTMGVDTAAAQSNVNWIGTVGNFNDNSNWDTSFVPISLVDEVGRINNEGTAIVDDEPEPTGGIVLGAATSDVGTLEIQSGGALTVEPFNEFALAPGSVIVGQSGTGHLEVMRGSSLVTDALSSGGNAASSIVLGESGTGTATVTVNCPANLNRNLRVVAVGDRV